MQVPIFSAFQKPPTSSLDPRIQAVWDDIPLELREGIGLYPSGYKSGAYFSPMPRGRGIYISDAFASKDPDLIRGVLLHELGHYNHYLRHGAKPVFVTIALAFGAVLLALYNVLATASPLPEWRYGTLAVFGFVLVNQLVFTPLMLIGKRRNELAADLFAVQHGGGEGMYAHLSDEGAVRPQLEFKRGYSYAMSTHPPTTYRLYALRQAGVNYEPAEITALAG